MEPQQALKLLVGILNQATLINRGGGRESGLTLEDRTAIGQAARACTFTALFIAQARPRRSRALLRLETTAARS